MLNFSPTYKVTYIFGLNKNVSVIYKEHDCDVCIYQEVSKVINIQKK